MKITKELKIPIQQKCVFDSRCGIDYFLTLKLFTNYAGFGKLSNTINSV